MNTFTKIFGEGSPRRIRELIEKDKGWYATIAEPKNLEEQAIKMVGRKLYRMLIKEYTEKQWGRSCSELPPSIIKRLPLRFTYDNCYFADLHQGIPIDGYTELIANMLESCEVRVGTPFSPTLAEAERVVWTGPIDEYFGYCYGSLEYRSLRFESEKCLPDGESEANVLGCAVTNFTSHDVPFTRMIEHKHFNNTRGAKTSIVTAEYSLEWKPGAEPYYPMCDAKNLELYAKYKALADEQSKVIFGGRLGTYRYLNMDQVIRNAIDDYTLNTVSH